MVSWAQCNKYFCATYRPRTRTGIAGRCKRHHSPCLKECSTSLWSPNLPMWPSSIMMQSRLEAARSALVTPIRLVLVSTCLSLPHSLFSGPNKRSEVQHIHFHYHQNLKNLEIFMTDLHLVLGSACSSFFLILFEFLNVGLLNWLY